MLSPQVELDEDQEKILALLRTRGFSIKYLDDTRRAEIRRFLDYLHNARGLSLNDVAKLIGNKTSGYTSWICRQLEVPRRPFEEARLKGIREKRRKYERRPFDGTDEDRAYLLGLRHGDLYVSKPWKGVVRVSTSTTHPAMAELFRSLFEPYGHVYRDPRYKKDTNSYEWNLYTILDDSFDFLLTNIPETYNWITSKPSLVLGYLAGLLDAEGNISIHAQRLLTVLNVTYYNTNLELLNSTYLMLSGLGFRPQRPYLDKKKGFRSPGYHIEMKKDYWRVVLGRFEECQAFLRELPTRHHEKQVKRLFAIRLHPGQAWQEVRPGVENIRAAIRSTRDAFVNEAKDQYMSNPRHIKQIAKFGLE